MYESMSLITDGNIETREPCRLREKSYSVATPFLPQRWGRFLSIFFKTRSGFCITSIANVTVSPRSKLTVSMESMPSRSH